MRASTLLLIGMCAFFQVSWGETSNTANININVTIVAQPQCNLRITGNTSPNLSAVSSAHCSINNISFNEPLINSSTSTNNQYLNFSNDNKFSRAILTVQ